MLLYKARVKAGFLHFIIDRLVENMNMKQDNFAEIAKIKTFKRFDF
jgi:hypothetical protein